MRDLINETQKHLLWQDEIGNEFLLTRYMEIFKFDEKKLKCYCWNQRIFDTLNNFGIVQLENKTDDNLYVFHTDLSNLPILLSMGVHSQRPYIKGLWIKDKKKRLAHDILKPGKLEDLNQTIMNYEVTINGITKNVKAKSRSKAQYKVWKSHPQYEKDIKKLKEVNIKIFRGELDCIDPNEGEQ